MELENNLDENSEDNIEEVVSEKTQDTPGVKVIKEYFHYFQLIEYKGKKIFYFNFNGRKAQDVIDWVPTVEPIIRSEPENSVLFLTDFSNHKYNAESLQIGKDFVKGNKPYIKKSGLIGITGLKKLALNAMITFSKRDNLKAVDSKEEGMEYLVAE